MHHLRERLDDTVTTSAYNNSENQLKYMKLQHKCLTNDQHLGLSIRLETDMSCLDQDPHKDLSCTFLQIKKKNPNLSLLKIKLFFLLGIKPQFWQLKLHPYTFN